MAEVIQDKNSKEEHLQLAAIIKGVHRHLRREYRASDRTHEEVWLRHTQNQEKLQLYADAMYRLATEHWIGNPETRIDWCRKVAIEYFYQNGLKVALEKDAKKEHHDLLRAKEFTGQVVDLNMDSSASYKFSQVENSYQLAFIIPESQSEPHILLK